MFGDAESIKNAEDRHAKLFLLHRSSTSELKKRQAEDYLSSDKVKVAKSYSGAPSPAQSIMGAYPYTQTQWPASVQPQAWPPATQAQGQWPAGYTQQAYNAYGGYQQMPAAAPQAAAYGAYPATYPAQPAAYPPQSYAQAAAPAQQPAPAQQAYYGNYYQ